MAREVEFVLNGVPTRVTPDAGESLLYTLRARCGLTSLKDGCHPQGQSTIAEGLPDA